MKQDSHGDANQLRQAEIPIRSAKLTSKNRDLLFTFKRELVVRGLTSSRILRYLVTLNTAGRWLKKDFDRLTKRNKFVFLFL